MSFREKADSVALWTDTITGKLQAKIPYAIEKAQSLDGMPYTVENCEWRTGPMDGICWWTNGFWPAQMWQMYLMTGDAQYLREANRAEDMLDEAFVAFDGLHHDVGFMWRISAGVNYDLTGQDKSRRRALHAANLLAGRFNPAGFIRAWNGDCTGWAIIDCMMNLSLLYWAWKHTSDPRFLKIANAHANTTMTHFVRPDGSCEHIVIFDPNTMEVLDKPGGQGYAPGSAWSRGQGWALYGFTLAYLYTGNLDYLNTAKRVAHYFLSCVGGDGIPDADFRAPNEPVMKDNIAGALAACGLLEIAKAMPEHEESLYFDGAIKLLQNMEATDADWSLGSPAIFRRCTGAYHGGQHRHRHMQYCDYFFIEAVNKLRGEGMLFW